MKYVIIGGDAAGMSAVMQIVKNDKNTEITTLEKGELYSYGQCGLPYAISGVIDTTDKLIARSVKTFREEYGINAKTNRTVERIEPKNKTVHGTNDKTGEAFEYTYDKLLIATGASPIIPNFKGSKLKGVYSLKTIPNAEDIMADMDENRIEKVVIVGGGYIGLEMVESFKMLGKEVRMIEHGDHVAKIFDAEMAAYIHEEGSKHGIHIHTNEKVEGLIGDDRVEKLKTDKGIYNADHVLISIGIQPNTEFIKETKIATGIKGAICVNRYMATNIQDIYAAGDCAEHYHLVKEKNDYIPLGTTASKEE